MENENKEILTMSNLKNLETETVQNEKQTEDIAIVETNSIEKRCPNCQALLTEEQIFCSECGTSLKKLCPNCKTELQEGQAFCPACGQKIDGKITNNSDITQFNASIQNNKRTNMPMICGVLGVIAIVIAVMVINTMKTQKIDNYISDAGTFAYLAMSASTNLADIADTAQEYWHDAIWNDEYNEDINTAVSCAMSDKSEEIETAEEQYSKIKELYSKLKKVPTGVKDENIDEICDAVKELYNDYTDFYSLATNPSGSYNSFSSSYSEKTDALSSSYVALDDLLADYNKVDRN